MLIDAYGLSGLICHCVNVFNDEVSGGRGLDHPDAGKKILSDIRIVFRAGYV
jgi:hypothetical protein